jgi:hypothetical protein
MGEGEPLQAPIAPRSNSPQTHNELRKLDTQTPSTVFGRGNKPKVPKISPICSYPFEGKEAKS